MPSDLYEKIDRLIQEPTRSILRLQTASGAEWLQGSYRARIYHGPPGYYRLDRKGGRKKLLEFADRPGISEEIARVILEHFDDPRNTT